MIPHGVEIFVGVEPIDLRWGFDRLSGIVSERIARPPRSGALYVFFGKRRDAIKILFADASGLCVFYKRLDRGEAMSQGSAGGGTEQGRTKHVWRKSCHFNDVASANAKLQDVLVLSTAGISGPNESFVRRPTRRCVLSHLPESPQTSSSRWPRAQRADSTPRRLPRLPHPAGAQRAW